MKKLYKSPEGKKEIFGLYDKMLEKLSYEFESTYVKTRFGRTHLLTGGNKNGEALFVFQGGNGINPQDLILYEKLAENYCIYTPDTPGYPGKSDEIALSPNNDEYGQWAIDLLDESGIEKANFMGYSCGGGVVMRSAAYAPERINKAVLINPMGVGMGSLLKMMFKLVFPYLSYLRSPSKEKLIRQLKPLYPEKALNDDLLEGFSCIYKNSHIVSASIKTPSKKELMNFTAPTLLIASENDIMFPAAKIVPKASKIIPNLSEIKILEKRTHGLGENDWQDIVEEILNFL